MLHRRRAEASSLNKYTEHKTLSKIKQLGIMHYMTFRSQPVLLIKKSRSVLVEGFGIYYMRTK